MKTLVAVILISFNLFNSYGQWTLVNTPFNTFSDLYFHDSNWGVLTGANLIASTFDEGESWEIVNVEELDMLSNIILTSDSVGYATSIFQFGYYKTEDKGSSWNFFGQPMYSLSLSEISFINNDTMYGVGFSGYFHKSYDGFLITNLDAISPAPLTSVYFIDADTGYVGGEEGPIKKTIDGGETWVVLVSSPIAEHIQFVSPSTGYVLSGGEIYWTSDYGGTWFQIFKSPEIEYYHINDMYFLSENIGYVTAYNEPLDKGVILKTIDGGLNWIINAIPNDIYQMGQIHCLNSDTCFAIGLSHTPPYTFLLKTINGGGIATGINVEVPKKSISIFPNPSSSFITIQSDHLDLVEPIVTNLYGQKVEFKIMHIEKNNLTIDISGLPVGIYFLQAFSSNEYQFQVSKIEILN